MIARALNEGFDRRRPADQGRIGKQCREVGIGRRCMQACLGQVRPESINLIAPAVCSYLHLHGRVDAPGDMCMHSPLAAWPGAPCKGAWLWEALVAPFMDPALV